jgi:hypothetical protein
MSEVFMCRQAVLNTTELKQTLNTKMMILVSSIGESSTRKTPNKACTGRLGLCAFFRLFPSYGSFLFPSLILPSRR